MLSNEATAYVLAAILFFIVGLIVFCCCRIWYDLLGCKEHRRNRSGAHGRGRARADGEDVRGGGGFDNDDDVMTDPEESGAAKPLTNSGESRCNEENCMSLCVKHPFKRALRMHS